MAAQTTGEPDTAAHIDLTIKYGSAPPTSGGEPPPADPPGGSVPSLDIKTGELSGLENSAKWLTVILGLVTAASTVTGATTDQFSRMASAFPNQVLAVFLCALVATFAAASAWLFTGATVVRRNALWVVLLAALVVIWGPWRALRLPAGPAFLVPFPIAMSVLVALVLLAIYTSQQALQVAKALLIGALTLVLMAVGGAVQIGASALKMYAGPLVSPSVTVEGGWATVATTVKVTGLALGEGVRVYLVKADDPATVYGEEFVGADVRGTVQTVVSMRAPTGAGTVEVRMTQCTARRSVLQADDPLACIATAASAAPAYARVAVGAPVPAATLAASISPATGKALTVTVSGAGLAAPVVITYTAGKKQILKATVFPDDAGSVVWSAAMPDPTPSTVTLTATSGSTTAEAMYVK